MLQSSASNLLTISTAQAPASENFVSMNSSGQQQPSEFNKIYSDIERQGDGSLHETASRSGETLFHQPDLFDSKEMAAEATELSDLQTDTSLMIWPDNYQGGGQFVSAQTLFVGNSLPFEQPLPDQAGQLTSDALIASEAGLIGAPLASDGWALAGNIHSAVHDGLGVDPLAIGSGEAAHSLSLLTLTSPSVVSIYPDIQTPLSSGTGVSPSQAATLSADAELKTNIASALSAQAAAHLQSDLEFARINEKQGLATGLSGLSLMSPPAALAGDVSLAQDAVPADVASSGNRLSSLQGTEVMDSQWLERIRQLQQVQLAGAGSSETNLYATSAIMDEYLASGDMAGALDLERQLAAAFNQIETGSELLQDKATVSSANLSVAQVRTVDPALKTYTTMLPQPVGEGAWIDSMGEKIVWLSGRNIQAAEIHLNPAELGPVEVKVQVQNDQTTVTFTVQQASVRELLEANVHRLREMMEGTGGNVRDVYVGSDTSGQEGSFAGNGEESEQNSGPGEGVRDGAEDAIDGVLTVLGTTSVTSRNVIDYYA